MGEIRFAAHVPARIPCCRAKLATFSTDAKVPALNRKVASGTLEGRLDFSLTCLHRAKLAVRSPPRSNAHGHYALSATSFAEGGVSPAPRGKTQSVSWVSKTKGVARPRFHPKGARFPDLGDGLRQFGAPCNSDARRAVLLGDASGSSAEEDRGA